MRQLGVPIISIGQKKYGHSKPFEMYAIQEEQELLAASKEAVVLIRYETRRPSVRPGAGETAQGIGSETGECIRLGVERR
jgi:hypothetical protein